MDIPALLTSAGINISVCFVLFSLYSVLRKQPSNRTVYFGRRLGSSNRYPDRYWLERFSPSPSWLVKAWEASEDEILAMGGLDAVAFQRFLIFSIRIFSIMAILCNFVVLPVNYLDHGKDTEQQRPQSLELFTIGNVRAGSKWLWVHCVAIYMISCCACLLLYYEYKSISLMRLSQITRCPPKPSHFTILVRAVPMSPGGSYSESVGNFFTNYYSSSYLSHQMVYQCGMLHKLMSDAEKMCRILKAIPIHKPQLRPCCFCGGSGTGFSVLSEKEENMKGSVGYDDLDLDLSTRDNECASALVFFKTRYSAVVASQMLQSANPMMWVSELAPEPHDILWANLSIPYRQLWLRKIATLLASIVFMSIFLLPVAFVQGLTQLNKLSRTFPFLQSLLKRKFMTHVVTGYLPSVILMLFLYTVPPTMMLFSSIEGPICRSRRKKSACLKILYFTIWNVFFVNVFSGSVISQLNVFSSVRDIPMQLAKAIPGQASFFMTYVLTSGWAGLACELMQLYPFLINLIKRCILGKKDISTDGLMSFPYHTEIPRVLLFGLIGFTCSIMAPLILPFLLVYFVMAYFVYRNQILNVYILKYDSGGQLWPILHNTTIFSLVLIQIVVLGVFGIKISPVASAGTIPLVILTLLFNQYCKHRFLPIFQKDAVQVLIEMDRCDQASGSMEEIYQLLEKAYDQFSSDANEHLDSVHMNHPQGGDNTRDLGQDISDVHSPSWAVRALGDGRDASGVHSTAWAVCGLGDAMEASDVHSTAWAVSNLGDERDASDVRSTTWAVCDFRGDAADRTKGFPPHPN